VSDREKQCVETGVCNFLYVSISGFVCFTLRLFSTVYKLSHKALYE
jgi:hypothetical protein